MKFLIQTLLSFVYLVLILTVHIFIINFLPYPFNHINIIFTIFLLIITVSTNNRVIWLILITAYFSELLSSIPFGISTAALLLSLLIINWFQCNILTNRSVYMIFLSAILGIILYRVLFVIFLTVHNYFFNLPGLPYKEITLDAGWEIVLSSLLLFLLYGIHARVLKFLHPSARNHIQIYG